MAGGGREAGRLNSTQRSAHPLNEGVELVIDGAAILGLRRLSHGLGAYPGRGQLKPCGAGSALVLPQHPPTSIDGKLSSNGRCRQERRVRVAVTIWEEIMAITPDFSAGVRLSDPAVALALVHAMLNRQGEQAPAPAAASSPLAPVGESVSRWTQCGGNQEASKWRSTTT